MRRRTTFIDVYRYRKIRHAVLSRRGASMASHFAMRRSGVRSPSAPPPQARHCRDNVPIAEGAAGRVWGNSSSNSSSWSANSRPSASGGGLFPPAQGRGRARIRARGPREATRDAGGPPARQLTRSRDPVPSQGQNVSTSLRVAREEERRRQTMRVARPEQPPQLDWSGADAPVRNPPGRARTPEYCLPAV